MICTLGPSCWSVEGLGALIDAGMSMARFNFSHGDHDAHGASLARLREAAAARPGCQVSAMLDTKGPEIRTGFFAAPNEGGKLKFKAGDSLILTSDYEHKSDGTKLACTYDKLATSVKVGANVLVADGSLVLEVVSLDPANGEVTTRVCNDQTIGERKNMNLPGVKVDLPVLQEKVRVRGARLAMSDGVWGGWVLQRGSSIPREEVCPRCLAKRRGGAGWGSAPMRIFLPPHVRLPWGLPWGVERPAGPTTTWSDVTHFIRSILKAARVFRPHKRPTTMPLASRLLALPVTKILESLQSETTCRFLEQPTKICSEANGERALQRERERERESHPQRRPQPRSLHQGARPLRRRWAADSSDAPVSRCSPGRALHTHARALATP